MRRYALSALLLATVFGCGVPDNTAMIAQSDKPAPKGTENETKEPEKPTAEVKTPEATEDPKALGLGIVDTKPGTGRAAEPGDTCFMLYTGRLKEKPFTVFDSTAKRDNAPFSFMLGSGQVIKGWDLGIKGMKEGGKRTLTIPAKLAYGSEAKGDDIPANSDLVFDIELLALVKSEEQDTVLRETLAPGTGPAAKKGDVVTIQYKGMLLGGKVVDDNGGKPLQVKLGANALAVPGLEIAIEGMKKGQKILATIPPALGLAARGPEGAGGVPPNSLLKFEVTLVKID